MKTGNQPTIISIPISYHDAAPILKALADHPFPKAGKARFPSRTTSAEQEPASISSPIRTTKSAPSGT